MFICTKDKDFGGQRSGSLWSQIVCSLMNTMSQECVKGILSDTIVQIMNFLVARGQKLNSLLPVKKMYCYNLTIHEYLKNFKKNFCLLYLSRTCLKSPCFSIDIELLCSKVYIWKILLNNFFEFINNELLLIVIASCQDSSLHSLHIFWVGINSLIMLLFQNSTIVFALLSDSAVRESHALNDWHFFISSLFRW